MGRKANSHARASRLYQQEPTLGTRIPSETSMRSTRPFETWWGLELPLLQRLSGRAGGVAAVAPQLTRLDASFGEAVEHGQQLAPLVLFPGPEQDREGDPARLDYEVKAAAGRASERARDLLAPL